MGKKIFLSIFGGIAVCGLVLVIVGFAMGADVRNFGVSRGEVVYMGENGNVPVGSWSWTFNGSVYTPAAVSNTQNAPSVAAPFEAEELQRMEVDVAAGILVIKSGSAYGLEVDGPMEYTTSWSNGTWRLTSSYNELSWRNQRFWLNGQDMTTTFTLTLPREFDTLSVSLGMGTAQVDGLTVNDLYCNANRGNVKLQNINAATANMDVDMGEIKTNNFVSENCTLSCNMGNIEYDGDITGTLTANCSMGNITARLVRPVSYAYKSEVGLGSVRIDGAHRGSGLTAGSYSGGAEERPFYDLDCGMGSIEIKFT